MRVIAYTRVSTEEQGESGLGLEAQRAAIDAYCDARGWEIVTGVTEARSSVKDRPTFDRVLGELTVMTGDRALVVSKLDRLARSVVDFGLILERANLEGWSVIALDLGVDTTTATGRMVANILMSVAQWEREIIGERTKAALQAKIARGEPVGRPPEITPSTDAHILFLREKGLTYEEIVHALEGGGFATARGGRWSTSTVRCAADRALRRREGEKVVLRAAGQ